MTKKRITIKDGWIACDLVETPSHALAIHAFGLNEYRNPQTPEEWKRVADKLQAKADFYKAGPQRWKLMRANIMDDLANEAQGLAEREEVAA